MPKQTPIQFIDNAQDLSNFCQRAQTYDWVGLDTEFIRERTYRPKLCLVQLSTADEIACIDPLTIDDLSPLYDILYHPNIIKVLHSASQDLEIFYIATGQVPAPIFDTQIAGAVLGYGDQVGYARLVESICNTTLDKSQSLTDWTRRPLSPKQIQYAGDDVNYLRDVFSTMRDELEKSGRTEWLKPDFDALTQSAKYEPNMDTLWQRVRQHNRLRGIQLAILNELAKWREQEAIRANKPRKWIASDELLLDLCKIKPNNTDALSRIRNADDGFVKRHGQTVIALIEQAKGIPQEQWPALKKIQRLTPNQEAMTDYLMACAKLKAEEHNISLATLVSKKQLEALILGDNDVPVMQSWRYHLLGEALAQVLAGQSQLTWAEGKLSLPTPS